MRQQLLLLGAFFMFGAAQSQNVFPTGAGTNVGIGTTSPATRLQITTGTTGQSGLRFTNLTSTFAPGSSTNKVLGVNTVGDVGLYNLATLYSGDGSLASNRVVTMSGNSLTFRPTTLGTDVFINGANGNVGIGTTTPSAKLDVTGIAKAYQAVFTSNLANGQTFSSVGDRNDKCTVLSAGRSIGSGSGYVNTRMFNFFDFPTSNLDAKATVFFGIEDRNDFGRYRFVAQTAGETYMIMYNKSQEEIMKVYEDGSDNVFAHFPKPNSRMVIGDVGTYLPSYKFVVRGSSKIEGDIITDAAIGIGTTNFVDGTDVYKLSVNGAVRAKRVKVYTTWADFVFEKDYKLPTLKEVEQHIQEKGHLKDIPSAKEVETNGIELGEMNKRLLQKVEELTLYMIEMNKEIETLKGQLNKQ